MPLAILTLDKLMRLYVNKGINAFCIDFDCRTPTSRKSIFFSTVSPIPLGENSETSFFYGINVNEGRFIHNNMIINAKDILAFGFGIDAIGGEAIDHHHFQAKNSEKSLVHDGNRLVRKENKVRLFIKTNYGYYRLQNKTDIEHYPIDSCIPQETFTSSINAGRAKK